MAVLPEGMERLDTRDVRGSLAVIERYINYMRERIEFAMSSAPARLYSPAQQGQTQTVLTAAPSAAGTQAETEGEERENDGDPV